MKIRFLQFTLLLLVSLYTAVAFAHSKKQKTYPFDGAIVNISPTQIGMDFNKPTRITFVRLIDSHGTSFKLERSDKRSPVTNFRAEAPVLNPGHYTIEWRGLAQDGHPMQGRFSFEIQG